MEQNGAPAAGQQSDEWLNEAVRLAMDFAHSYAFVGDDTMPKAKARLMEHLATRATLPAACAEQREPWVPYLSDRADGVKGHYAVCRWNPGVNGLGYREAWNLRRHCWASASDDVLTLGEARSLLCRIEIPTAASCAPKQTEGDGK